MPTENPFAALSLIVAPAILTNACSVLIMSTSNRFARAVDRARELSREIEGGAAEESATVRRLHELGVTEQRALLLVRAMRNCYVALSGFASAALLSLLGAVLVPAGLAPLTRTFEVLGITAGAIAVAALISGSVLLVRDTWLAHGVLQRRASSLQQQARRRIQSDA